MERELPRETGLSAPGAGMCLRLETTCPLRRLWWWCLAGEQLGAEIVEAALVIPILLMLLIGIVWMGRAYAVYEAITRAAREGTRVLVLTSCATCGNSFYSASTARTNYLEPSLTAAGLDPANLTNFSATYQWLDPGATPPEQCGIAISFSYPFQFVLPFTSLNLSTISISTRVQMRMENQPATCSAGSAVP